MLLDRYGLTPCLVNEMINSISEQQDGYYDNSIWHSAMEKYNASQNARNIQPIYKESTKPTILSEAILVNYVKRMVGTIPVYTNKQIELKQHLEDRIYSTNLYKELSSELRSALKTWTKQIYHEDNYSYGFEVILLNCIRFADRTMDEINYVQHDVKLCVDSRVQMTEQDMDVGVLENHVNNNTTPTNIKIEEPYKIEKVNISELEGAEYYDDDDEDPIDDFYVPPDDQNCDITTEVIKVDKGNSINEEESCSNINQTARDLLGDNRDCSGETNNNIKTYQDEIGRIWDLHDKTGFMLRASKLTREQIVQNYEYINVPGDGYCGYSVLNIINSVWTGKKLTRKNFLERFFPKVPRGLNILPHEHWLDGIRAIEWMTSRYREVDQPEAFSLVEDAADVSNTQYDFVIMLRNAHFTVLKRRSLNSKCKGDTWLRLTATIWKTLSKT